MVTYIKKCYSPVLNKGVFFLLLCLSGIMAPFVHAMNSGPADKAASFVTTQFATVDSALSKLYLQPDALNVQNALSCLKTFASTAKNISWHGTDIAQTCSLIHEQLSKALNNNLNTQLLCNTAANAWAQWTLLKHACNHSCHQDFLQLEQMLVTNIMPHGKKLASNNKKKLRTKLNNGLKEFQSYYTTLKTKHMSLDKATYSSDYIEQMDAIDTALKNLITNPDTWYPVYFEGEIPPQLAFNNGGNDSYLNRYANFIVKKMRELINPFRTHNHYDFQHTLLYLKNNYTKEWNTPYTTWANNHLIAAIAKDKLLEDVASRINILRTSPRSTSREMGPCIGTFFEGLAQTLHPSTYVHQAQAHILNALEAPLIPQTQAMLSSLEKIHRTVEHEMRNKVNSIQKTTITKIANGISAKIGWQASIIEMIATRLEQDGISAKILMYLAPKDMGELKGLLDKGIPVGKLLLSIKSMLAQTGLDVPLHACLEHIARHPDIITNAAHNVAAIPACIADQLRNAHTGLTRVAAYCKDKATIATIKTVPTCKTAPYFEFNNNSLDDRGIELLAKNIITSYASQQKNDTSGCSPYKFSNADMAYMAYQVHKQNNPAMDTPTLTAGWLHNYLDNAHGVAGKYPVRHIQDLLATKKFADIARLQ